MKKLISSIIKVFLLLLFLSPVFAEKTPFENLYQYELSNGLKLFVAENHCVPLTYIEIAVKCGAYTQDVETAGLFHLYEHMMFKGNKLYKNAASVTNAISDLGVSNWNGATDLECVNYYFTVPSGETRKGLEFWNAAIRFPLLDKNEFENEKKVVISEITGNMANPSRIYMNYENKKMFSDAPWKLDPSGSVRGVQNASIKTLKNIQKTFYIPNNSALFVGGDVNPDEVFQMVKEIFGNWKKAKNPFEKGVLAHNKEPFSSTQFAVMPSDKVSREIAQISVVFRAPDVAFDREDTYSMDILTDSLSEPKGIFKRSILADGYIGVPQAEYVSAGYLTRRSCGKFSINAIVTMPEEELSERAKYFSKQVESLLKDAVQSISEENVISIVSRIEDSNIFANETSRGILNTMRFWWTVADEEYFYTYNEKMSRITSENVSKIISKYIEGKNPLVTVLVNSELYEEIKDSFQQSGFDVISAENAFWFD